MNRLLLFIVALVGISQLIKGYSLYDLVPAMLAIAGVMFVLSLVAKQISSMSWNDLGRAGAGITGLAAIIVGLIAATRLAGDKELVRVGSTLIALSIAIGILAGIAVLLGLIDPIALLKGVGAIAALGIIMAGMIIATKFAQDSMKNIIVMTIAIAVMAAAVAGLSSLDTKNVLIATGCIAALMGMFALMSKAAGNMKGSMGSLLAMTAVVGALAGIIYLLSGLPIENVLTTVGALSVLLISLS